MPGITISCLSTKFLGVILLNLRPKVDDIPVLLASDFYSSTKTFCDTEKTLRLEHGQAADTYRDKIE